jgi:hypothetical protein
MFRTIVVIFLLPLFLAGCDLRAREAPPEDVDKAAGLFFERLNSAQYEAIYNDATKDFKTQPRNEVVDKLKQMAAFGTVRTHKRIKMNFLGDAKVRAAEPVYTVIFDEGVSEITFQFMDEGGEWKLHVFTVKQRGAPPQQGGEPTQPAN